jgi:8-oxo-dGTP pyrophosphatase MutT (NUDIX family)
MLDMMETDARFFVGIKALIKNKKNEVLVLKSGPAELKSTMRTTPFWDLPGGKIRIGEGDMKQTLAREVSEELGVPKSALKIGSLFDASVSKFKIQHGKKIPLVLVTFECKLKGASFKLTDEHEKFSWVSLRKAKRMLSIKFNNSFISRLR